MYDPVSKDLSRKHTSGNSSFWEFNSKIEIVIVKAIVELMLTKAEVGFPIK